MEMNQFAAILPLILALLLIFVIPMLMRRYGLEPGDLLKLLTSRLKKQDYASASKTLKEGKGRREPYQSNGRSGDLKSLVSTLLIFARRNGCALVYPGTVSSGEEVATLLALLVTKQTIYGFNCFGYGGTITRKDGRWMQHMNGTDQEIPDPVKANKKQYTLVRRVMDQNGMKGIPLEVAAVFTSRSSVLAIPPGLGVYETKDLLQYLKEQVDAESAVIDPDTTARMINGQVHRISRGKRN